MMQESFKEKGQRQQLIESLQNEKDITDANVLIAMNKVPRHLFMLKGLEHFAYVDKAFRIASGQTISQPYTVAFQSQLLQIKRGDKVLEIGTGSGYQTAVLLEMGAKVFTIERQRELFTQVKKFLPSIGYNPQIFFGDGYKGKPTYGPFDKIIITAGAPYIPEALIEQLKPGGSLVIPLGEKKQIMTRISKQVDGSLLTEEFGDFSFVPMLPGTAYEK